MTVIKSEFFLALNQVATERGISLDDVLDSIKTAVLAAYKKDYGSKLSSLSEDKEETKEKIEVKINKDTGETKVFIDDQDATPPGFGRIAAQTARQVVLQKIREAEKKTVIKHYFSQVGTIIKGRVIRFDGRNVYFDIGRAEGILPQEEQVRGENYKLNDSFVVYIKEIKEDNFDNSKIMVSRKDPRLIEELFKKEVPEVANGTVKIKKIVRETGDRSKMAVFSTQSGVDPVGACVGQKGMRVKAVTDELGGGEKIDIIQWQDDDLFFLKEALSPATITSIEIDKENKRAKVFVDEKQAPLAIGKGGVNVNLASRLTDYIIDILQLKSLDNGKNVSSKIEKEKEKKTQNLEKSDDKDKKIENENNK